MAVARASVEELGLPLPLPLYQYIDGAVGMQINELLKVIPY